MGRRRGGIGNMPLSALPVSRLPNAGANLEHRPAQVKDAQFTLIDFFKTSSTQTGTSSHEPHHKRRKIEEYVEACDSVVVKRSSLTGTFPTSKPSNGNQFLERLNAPILVTIDALSEELYHVHIHHTSKKDIHRTQILNDVIFVKGLLPLEDIRLAQRVASEAGLANNPAGQGRLWTETDIRLGHKDGSDYLEINFTVKWGVSTHTAHIPTKLDRPALQAILALYFPRDALQDEGQEPWSPQDFYSSVYVPEKEDPIADSIITSRLEADLFPFQKRSLRWLLEREGKQPSSTGTTLIDLQDRFHSNELPYSFQQFKGDGGQTCFVSHLFQIITLDVEPFRQTSALKGGILSEEMGLGKTVEIIALISLHKRQLNASGVVHDSHTAEMLREASATLIITPPAILSQWKSELSRHAPALKVMHYEGIGHKTYRTLGHLAMLDKLAQCDVVLSTYNVLAKEVHHTLPPPDRNFRYVPRYERLRSPLTQLSWWRICLDEAQMVDSGVSNAALVATMLPRINAWGISGTPIKRDVTDLLGLLIFLRFEPFPSSKQIWKSLISHHRTSFKQLFNKIALRHTKEFVRDELRLPPQKRFVITMPFMPVEEQHYQSLFDEMCEAVGVDRSGAPLHDDWSPNNSVTISTMKTWLNRLRQTALHPEVGNLNRRNLGRREGPMRTVDEVLEAMLEQSESSIRIDQRALLMSKLKQGQVLENGPRVKEAMILWTDVLNVARGLVADCRAQLRNETTKRSGDDAEKSRDVSYDSEDDAQDHADRANSESSKIGTLRSRLRGALEIEHMATFYQANAYFQIKSNPEFTEPDSEPYKELEKKETNGYELAKNIRQEILKETFHKANRRMKKLANSASSQSFEQIPEFPIESVKGGIESRRILEQLNDLAGTLDAQADQLDDWREKTIQFLLRPLVDDESNTADITGEEYEESTKTQDEVMAYVQALRAMIEDRHDALTGQENILVASEVKSAIRLAKDKDGACPDKVLELLGIRGRLKPRVEAGSIRAVISDLRALSNTLKIDAERGSGRAATEFTIVEEQRQKVQKRYSDQSKAVVALRQEIDDFTALMNARLEFYRALQAVSDMVAPLEKDEEEKPAYLQSLTNEEVRLTQKIATASAKHRYLVHLRQEDSDQQRMCVICQCTFELGSLTVCGHQFCKSCILMWWRAHHNCPVCKKRLTLNDLHDITYKPQELKVAEEIGSLAGRSLSKKSSIYSDISNNTLSQIKNIELAGPSFTTKVDTLARHLIWLREADPGAKTIIFSQYKEFIHVLCRALAAHRIGYTTIEGHTNMGGAGGGVERFKQDPAIECFLLHARAHSSGLNLVNASHVILCEPLINTAIELQAIARVDRIGQLQETTVWLYLVDGTIEQSIHEISVRRRMEHMINTSRKGKEKELTPELLDKTIEAANSRELQDAGSITNLLSKGNGEGENVQNDDLWACLFGNVGERAGPLPKELESEVRRHLRAEAADQRIVEELE